MDEHWARATAHGTLQVLCGVFIESATTAGPGFPAWGAIYFLEQEELAVGGNWEISRGFVGDRLCFDKINVTAFTLPFHAGSWDNLPKHRPLLTLDHGAEHWRGAIPATLWDDTLPMALSRGCRVGHTLGSFTNRLPAARNSEAAGARLSGVLSLITELCLLLAL